MLTTFDPARGTTTNTYDLAGRLATETDALGRQRVYTYDDAGRRTKVRDGRGNETTYVFDAAGRQTAVVAPGGATKQTEYDLADRLTAEVDELGRRTEFTYDGLGQLTSVKDALAHVTSYAYDEVGNRISRTDALGKVTAYGYDQVGRETRRTLPDAKYETKEYDPAGRMTARVDFAGRRTTLQYDANDQLLAKLYPGGGSARFTYSLTGRRLTMSDPHGVTTYTYDNRDRLTRKLDPTGYSLEYGYDSGGRRTLLKANVGATSRSTTYAYDAAGQIATVTDPDGRVFTMTYDEAGNPSRLVRPNGVDTVWTHDARNQLANIRTFNRTTDATIASYAYTVDATGHRTRIVEADGTDRAYGYDALYRLTNETVTGGTGPQYAKTFTYDAVSNRTKQVTTGFGAATVDYTYDDRQRLLTENGVALSWDDNGNMLGKVGGDQYTWDSEDRLIRVTKATGEVLDNTYDADGVLVRTSVTPAGGGAASATELVVDTNGELSHVVGEVSGGALGLVYLHIGDLLVGEVRGGVASYHEGEAIGSVRSILDGSGVRTAAWAYSAFGEDVASSTSGTERTYGFAGQRFVAAAQLYQNRARWLNASLGRFLSTDPQDSDPEKPETLNVYRYAANDPVSMVDPSGRSDLLSIATVTAAVSVLSTLSLPATSWAAKPAREIVVDVNTQRVFSLARGVTFRTMEGITGDGEHPTPRGSFRIRSKRREYRSKKYDAQMNYAMFFNGGVALHQFHGPPGSFWLIRALKTGVSDYFGSHGCVRLTEEDAETLFDWAAVNDPVTVK